MITQIANDWLSAQITDRGAELLSLRDKDGNEMIWGRDQSIWGGSAPILFPVIGRLRDGQYAYQGGEYTMPKHGIARNALFDCEQRDELHAAFTLRDSSDTHAVFPFPFTLQISFVLAERVLKVSATISNCGDSEMPCNFGFHPAFRWPLPFGGSREDHRVVFEKEEAAKIRRVDGQGLLLSQEFATPFERKILVPRDNLFTNDAIILENISSRRLSFGVPGARMIGVGFDGFSSLGIWTKPGAGFLCIEPWNGLPDGVGSPTEIDRKSGMRLLAPQQTVCHTMTIEPFVAG